MAYDPATAADGYRVLIDRLWPRGIARERAALDEWERELAPSTELRQWFGHQPSRFEEFRRRYIEELPPQQSGWLAGLRDPAVGKGLALIHARPGGAMVPVSATK